MKKTSPPPVHQAFPLLKTVEQMSKISGLGEHKLRELMDSGQIEYIINLKIQIHSNSDCLILFDCLGNMNPFRIGNMNEDFIHNSLSDTDYRRGFYTGIMGHYADGQLDSAVMIRFIEQENGQLHFKAGGGITAKSRWESEYNEVIQKIYVPIY